MKAYKIYIEINKLDEKYSTLLDQWLEFDYDTKEYKQGYIKLKQLEDKAKELMKLLN